MTERITAAYNFVPLSPHVCRASDLRPGFGERPAQDVPVEGGMSGEITITLETRTPFLIGGAQTGTKRFQTDPEGKPVVPGSSLRGMIRNVMEVATFGKFCLVDERTTGVRDLAPTARVDYGSRVSEQRSDRSFAPKTRAGWLHRKNGQLVLTPCAFGRIDHSDLDRLAQGFGRAVRDVSRDKDQNKRQAQQVEELFLRKGGSTETTLHVEDKERAHPHDRKELTYRKVTPGPAAGATAKKGHLVFTGLPGPKKHMEFFFFDPNTPIKVGDTVWQRFVAVHEEQEKESETWKWRRAHLDAGGRIPVFWLPDGSGGVDRIGLAMMFKLAADNSTHDMIRHTADDHLDPAVIDLPTRIFGRLDKDEGFRTRVSFGWGELTGGTPGSFKREVVGAAPKPGFLPSYVRQVDFGEDDGTLLAIRPGERPQYAQYRSYMDWENKREELRGWKRYPARGDGAHEPPPIPNSVGEKARTTLDAIYDKNGLRFAATVRFHNLHPVEIGALLWCLDWGAEAGLRHGLGMGKPYGWGQVAVTVEGMTAIHDEGAPDEATCRAAFIEAMEAWASSKGMKNGWAGSVQMMRLRAMADPALGATRQASHLRQMVLNPDVNRNEFLDAKKAGGVLPEYRHPSEAEWAPPGLAVAQVKGAPRGGGSARAAGGRGGQDKRRTMPAPPAGPFRAGERVTWVDEAMTVAVLSDERDGMVEIDAEGDIETVSATELKR